MAGVTGERKADGVIGCGIAGMQRCHHVDLGGQLAGSERIFHRAGKKAHAREIKTGSEFARFFDEFLAGFDPDDFACLTGLEVKVVKDKAQIGFAGAVIDQTIRTFQQRFDELVEVINLLELPPSILIQLAITRQDV